MRDSPEQAGDPAYPNAGIFDFAARAARSVASAQSALRLAATKEQRILRRFSLREACGYLGIERATLDIMLRHPDAPTPVAPDSNAPTQFMQDPTLSASDLMTLRAIADSANPAEAPARPFWRGADQPPVTICFSSQKGGSGKSIAASNLAIAAALSYGMRVAVIDADPQATASLYFATDRMAVANAEAATFVRFMGVDGPKDPLVDHDGLALDQFWQATPWPGLRLLPGGAEIQEADIALHFLAARGELREHPIHRILRDALGRWIKAHPATVRADDLRDATGRLDRTALAQGMSETVDLIVIDCAPSLSISQLNAVVASDMLVVPQTMRGFDLSTLEIYLGSLAAYGDVLRTLDRGTAFAPLPSYILPTIVSSQSDTDMRHVAELYVADPEIVCPVFYGRSEAVANAAEDYMSIYEYAPPKSRRTSASAFLANANAVAEAVLSRAFADFPIRGYANAFIRERLPEGMPLWTREV
ncbi:ParA family protein [Rubrimonas cliftonensis]|uniref:Chromosome partitioning protein n=1 Tax=Rubrimonas cliftonensis TaxID=89524 RepID=A0A1H4GBH3_9RHOB|nr:ParA family protein [Rubrimonas cliftonensis]SEB06330.1 chromosome partitioning protein [Rubrimonas cliftonensis]